MYTYQNQSSKVSHIFSLTTTCVLKARMFGVITESSCNQINQFGCIKDVQYMRKKSHIERKYMMVFLWVKGWKQKFPVCLM